MLSRMQMGIMLEEEKTGEAYPGLNLAINSVLRQRGKTDDLSFTPNTDLKRIREIT